MKYPRGLLAWILYGAGHLLSRPMCRFDLPVYGLYNWLMLSSSDVQVSDCGPWQAAKLKQ